MKSLRSRLDRLTVQSARPIYTDAERISRLSVVVDAANRKGVDALPEPERRILALLDIARQRRDATNAGAN